MLLHTYGITETAGISCCLQPQDHDLTLDENGNYRAASCGVPSPLVDMMVVDNDDNQVPTGEIGEVVFGGPKIMKEYWRKPEITAEALRGGWYHTGDMGYVDETGHLYLVDRKKDMIISGAENIYSVEVENVISTHPSVQEVAVIGIPHDVWGEQVHAVVVKRDGGEDITGEDVIDFLPRQDRRLQDPEVRFVRRRPAVHHRTRQDRQAPSARSVLGGQGTADLIPRRAGKPVRGCRIIGHGQLYSQCMVRGRLVARTGRQATGETRAGRGSRRVSQPSPGWPPR